jgi:hypothetical protein
MVEQATRDAAEELYCKIYPEARYGGDDEHSLTMQRIGLGYEDDHFIVQALIAAEARGMEKSAKIVEGMGTSFDSTAGERFAKAIRAALNGGQHEQDT